MPKMSGYFKTFKVQDKINKLMSFRIDDEKILEKDKAIWTKIEDFYKIVNKQMTDYPDENLLED